MKHFYYVPFLHVNQRFPIYSISQVFHKEQSFFSDTATVRVYGTGYSAFTPVWWAYDGLRRVQHANHNVVIKLRSQLVRKGFSVENFDAFLVALTPLLGKGVGVEHGFPSGLKVSISASDEDEKKQETVGKQGHLEKLSTTVV